MSPTVQLTASDPLPLSTHVGHDHAECRNPERLDERGMLRIKTAQLVGVYGFMQFGALHVRK